MNDDVQEATRWSMFIPALGVAFVLLAAGCGSSSDSGESGAGAPGDSSRTNASAAVDTTESSANTPASDATAATSGAAALVPDDLKGTTLEVAMELPYPPFGFYDENNTPVGFEIDLIAGVSERLGVEMNVENSAFDSIIPSLASGRFDIGWSAFTITAERTEVVDFVQYYQEGTAAVVPSGNPDGLSIDALCGVTTAILLGSTQEAVTVPTLNEECVAAGNPEIDALVLPASEDLALAVSSGRAKVMLTDRSVAAFQTKEQADEFEIAPGDDRDPAPFGVALPKGSELAPAISAALDEMIADGSYLTILEGWNVEGGAVTSADINPTL